MNMTGLDELQNYGYKADSRQNIFTGISIPITAFISWLIDLPGWLIATLPFVVSAMVFWWFHVIHEREKQEKKNQNKQNYDSKLDQIRQEWITESLTSPNDIDSLAVKQHNEVQLGELTSESKNQLKSEIDVCKVRKEQELVDKEKNENLMKKHLQKELAIHDEEIDLETFNLLSSKFSEEIDTSLNSLVDFDGATIELRLREIKNRQMAEADDTFRRPVKGGESSFHIKIKNNIKVMIDKAEAKLKFQPERYFSNATDVQFKIDRVVLNPAALGSPDYADYGAWVDGQFYAIECFSLENKLSDDELKAEIIHQYRDYQPEITRIVKEYGHRFFFLRFGIIYE
jgi:hypothetical protein